MIFGSGTLVAALLLFLLYIVSYSIGSLPQYTVRSRTQERLQLAKIDSEYVEISKLRVFLETFNCLSGCDRMDVYEYDLIRELIKTGQFDDEQLVGKYIMEAMELALIYRRKPGMYTKV